jgi:carbamoyltransferase
LTEVKILGISAYYHDAAAALIIDGEIVSAAQEERFTRVKHDPSFPIQAIKYCLDAAGLTIDALDAVVFYDKPFLKFERLLETYYRHAPRGWWSFLRAMPVWMREKLFMRTLIARELRQIGDFDKKKLKLLFSTHHLSHAASAFYPSPFGEAAILTIDGVGEWTTTSICHGQGSDIRVLRELLFPDSVGMLYSAFTYFLGFKVNSGEYKLMGLAPYGDPASADVKRYIHIIKKTLVDIKPDGSIQLNQSYFTYAVGERMVDDKQWQKLLGLPKRKEADELILPYANLALAIQLVTEEIIILLAHEAKRLTGSDYLCLAGGVALNATANGVLQRTGLFREIWIQPAAGDAGGAIGAALAAYHIHAGQERIVHRPDGMQGSYLGAAYTDSDIAVTLDSYQAIATAITDEAELVKQTATLLATGKVVGWYQGRAEFGPRALGNRSILADPRHPDMQQILNLQIKFREGFRPFAPSVLAADAAMYFDTHAPSPYMLVTVPVSLAIRLPLPDDYPSQSIRDKLATSRSSLPAITHIDGSARIQTVTPASNPIFHDLLAAFKDKTGCGVLINTSFNMRGEPPVWTPSDAYRCFMATGMDALVIGHYLLLKTEQPHQGNMEMWHKAINLD